MIALSPHLLHDAFAFARLARATGHLVCSASWDRDGNPVRGYVRGKKIAAAELERLSRLHLLRVARQHPGLLGMDRVRALARARRTSAHVASAAVRRAPTRRVGGARAPRIARRVRRATGRARAPDPDPAPAPKSRVCAHRGRS